MKLFNKSDRTYYYVDYENVSAEKMHELEPLLKEQDSMIVFYSSACVCRLKNNMFDFIKLPCDTQFILCHNGNKNAMDFVLISYMGKNIMEKRTGNHVVISDDKGYDASINFWRQHGKTVCRFSDNAKDSGVYDIVSAKPMFEETKEVKNAKRILRELAKSFDEQIIEEDSKYIEVPSERSELFNAIRECTSSDRDAYVLEKSVRRVNERIIMNDKTSKFIMLSNAINNIATKEFGIGRICLKKQLYETGKANLNDWLKYL